MRWKPSTWLSGWVKGLFWEMRIAARPNASLMQHVQQRSPRESPVVQSGANARRNGQWETDRELHWCKACCETSYLLLYLLISKCSLLTSQWSLFLSGSKVIAEPFPVNSLYFSPALYFSFLTQTFLPQTHPYANCKGRRRTDHSHTGTLHLPWMKFHHQ